MRKKTSFYGRSDLARRILLQYVLAVLGYIAAVFLFYYMAWFVCSSFIWQKDDPLYHVLKALQALSPVLIVLLILLGLICLTYRFLNRPLDYLDELLAAAEQLSRPTEEPLRLSPAMKGVEDELNLVREQALRSAAAAREAEQRKNDLIVYLAHDLKTPLTSVIGYLTLLRDEPALSPQLRDRYTGVALDKALRLEDLINEFFDITRFNLSRMELSWETVDLCRMLQQIASEFAPVLQEKRLSCRLQLPRQLSVVCDPDKLSRVFDNLFRNAASYSYPDTEITVTLQQEGERARISVENHGKTIPPEKLQRIFEQFFRLDSARATATGGAGLGLAIAREIVELHGGSISAQSREETVTFLLELPLQRQKNV